MNWTKYNNPASYIGFALILFNAVLAVAYLIQRDYRRSLYFFFAAGITATVVL